MSSRPCPDGCRCGKHAARPGEPPRPTGRHLPDDALQPCGSLAALRRHGYRGEEIDQACREAGTVAQATYRAGLRARAAQIAGHPVSHREAARILQRHKALQEQQERGTR